MIYLYSGTPGSGKSLHAAYKLITWLRVKKRPVVANFPIDMGYFKKKKVAEFTYLDNTDLTVQALKNYAQENFQLGKEHQGLLIIDECASMFNPRSWDRKDRSDWIWFFQQHRKLGFDVILVSQNDRLIDRQIRAFIETEYKHRAIRNYKLIGSFLSFLSGGLFIAVEYWYGVREKCGSQLFTLNRKKARIYDTYKLFD